MRIPINSLYLICAILSPFLSSFFIAANNGVDPKFLNAIPTSQIISIILIGLALILFTLPRKKYPVNIKYRRGIWLLTSLTFFALLSSFYNGNTIPLFGVFQILLLMFIVRYRQISHDELMMTIDLLFYVISILIAAAFIVNVTTYGEYFANIEPLRYQPLNNITSLNYRWGSIFGYANLSGYFGALMIVYGIEKRSIKMNAVAFVGGITLLTSESIGALFAFILCLLCFAVWGSNRRIRYFSFLTLVPMASIVVFIFNAGFFKPNIENANGRIQIWEDYLSLPSSFSDYLFGVGQYNIEDALSLGLFNPQASNAHFLLLDGFVRYGLIFFIFELFLFIFLLRYSINAVRCRSPFILGVLVVFLVSSCSEALIDWLSFTPLYVMLLLLLLMNTTIAHKAKTLDSRGIFNDS
jgi:hypothetical protein